MQWHDKPVQKEHWLRSHASIENVKKVVKGRKVGFPKFPTDCRSVEYQTNSGKLADDRKSIKFTDKCGIGRLKMKGTGDLGLYNLSSNQAGEIS